MSVKDMSQSCTDCRNLKHSVRLTKMWVTSPGSANVLCTWAGCFGRSSTGGKVEQILDLLGREVLGAFEDI